jgi:hypothetical protein
LLHSVWYQQALKLIELALILGGSDMALIMDTVVITNQYILIIVALFLLIAITTNRIIVIIIIHLIEIMVIETITKESIIRDNMVVGTNLHIVTILIATMVMSVLHNTTMDVTPVIPCTRIDSQELQTNIIGVNFQPLITHSLTGLKEWVFIFLKPVIRVIFLLEDIIN